MIYLGIYNKLIFSDSCNVDSIYQEIWKKLLLYLCNK